MNHNADIEALLQIEYPFLRYNIFSCVNVLSFYERARTDKRFLEALDVLRSKLDTYVQLVIERPNRKLAGLRAFSKDQPSEPATKRFPEIQTNLQRR